MLSFFNPVKTPPPTPSTSRPNTPVNSIDGLAYYLMQKSNVPQEYQDRLHDELIKQIELGKKYPDAHTDQELMSLSRHTCTRSWVKRSFEDLYKRIDGQDETTKNMLIDGFMPGLAVVLGHGFDKVESSKLILDNGKIRGIRDPRQAECNTALEKGETLGGKKHKRKTLRKRKTKRRNRKH